MSFHLLSIYNLLPPYAPSASLTHSLTQPCVTFENRKQPYIRTNVSVFEAAIIMLARLLGPLFRAGHSKQDVDRKTGGYGG